MNKYESKTQPGLFYWAEPIDMTHRGGHVSFMVVSQVNGFPATEAFDDWMAYEAEADRIAQDLAAGKDIL